MTPIGKNPDRSDGLKRAAGKTRVPRSAAWLGALGATPFIVLSVLSIIGEGVLQERGALALATYSAVILSFLGGVHWGLAIAEFGPVGSDAMYSRLLVSVLPSLVGWAALLAPPVPGLLVLAAAFSTMLALDVRSSRLREAPAWYPRLRWPLSLVVVTALVASALGA